MSLLEKVKAGAQQAAVKTRDEVQELQTKRELNQTYTELGRKVFELAKRGDISHAEIGDLVERARTLTAQLEVEKTA
jgi:hypothetical protein